MGTTVTVDELEVDPKRLTVAGQSHGYLAFHAVEEEGAITLFALSDTHLLAGAGRDEHFGLEAGSGHLGRLGDFGGQNALLDEKDIGVEPGSLVAGHHLADGSIHPNHFAGGKDALQGDHIVELEKLAVPDTDPELQWCGVPGPQDSPDQICHGVRG